MNIDEKIKKLAKLDNLQDVHRATRKGERDANGVVLRYLSNNVGGWKEYEPVPTYFKSYDAILPLIQKIIFKDDNDKITKFWDALNKMTNFFDNDGHVGMLKSTPEQLCDALLKAHEADE